MQCRLGRAALGWSLDQAAAASGVNRRTILRYEQRESAMRGRNREALRRAFESAGVRFIDRGEFAGGIVPPAGA